LATAFDLIVIGEGITGLACAKHAASLGLKTATTEGNLFGGLVINVAELEGYDEHGSGVDIASALMEANASAGVENLGATVTALEPDGSAIRVKTEGGDFTARAVVIASGARMRKLGVPGEEEYDHRGVSQCADCDGPMFQGEHVVVAGGLHQGDGGLHHRPAAPVDRAAFDGGDLRRQGEAGGVGFRVQMKMDSEAATEGAQQPGQRRQRVGQHQDGDAPAHRF